MNTTLYLQKQFANANAIFHGMVEDLTDEEWVARPAPGQNMLGYTVWHMPRSQDSFVQTWIRGITEVVHRGRWNHWQSLRRLGIGVGISLDDADEIARSIKRMDVLEYADVVHQEIAAWLGERSESDLDQILDIRQRLTAFPEYQTPGFVEEVAGLYDQPIWSLLMRPCIEHIHRHLGELEVMKHISRVDVCAGASAASLSLKLARNG
jgi:DinB superfamily